MSNRSLEWEDDFLKAFNAGLAMAARIAVDWAAEAQECGGKSAGLGYLNLAEAIMRKIK